MQLCYLRECYLDEDLSAVRRPDNHFLDQISVNTEVLAYDVPYSVRCEKGVFVRFAASPSLAICPFLPVWSMNMKLVAALAGRASVRDGFETAAEMLGLAFAENTFD